MLDSNDPGYLRRELVDAQTRGDYWRDQVIPLVTFARWVVSLDDPAGPGYEARRMVSLDQIVQRARDAIDGSSSK